MADAAFEKYGYVAILAKTIPDLKQKLNEALAQGWDAARFSKEIQNTNWWKNSSDSVKQLQILKATKPGEYKQQLSAVTDKISRMANTMGVTLTGGAKGSLTALANHALMLGWDDTQLQQHIGDYFTFSSKRPTTGTAGAIIQQIREMRAQYGAGQNDADTAHWTKFILQGRGTLEGMRQIWIDRAKSKYPSFAQQLDAGQTMQQIASPYMQMVAQTLELDPASVDLNDSYVQRALTARDPKTGNPSSVPLWQLQDQLRHDPRYDHTKQAVNDAYSMLNEIGRGMGFSAA